MYSVFVQNVSPFAAHLIAVTLCWGLLQLFGTSLPLKVNILLSFVRSHSKPSASSTTKRHQTCERFMASLAQLSTSLWRSSVKVPFLWWGADIFGAKHWELPWLWHKPEPLTALVLVVPAEGGEKEAIKKKKKSRWGFLCLEVNLINVQNGWEWCSSFNHFKDCYRVTAAGVLGHVRMLTWAENHTVKSYYNDTNDGWQECERTIVNYTLKPVFNLIPKPDKSSIIQPHGALSLHKQSPGVVILHTYQARITHIWPSNPCWQLIDLLSSYFERKTHYTVNISQRLMAHAK